MKIATYNVNSVNARLPVLLRWLADARPDVACLQELKAPQEKFPEDAIREAGFDAVCWAPSPELTEGLARRDLTFVGGMASGDPAVFPTLLNDLREAGALHVNVQLGDDETLTREALRLTLALMDEAYHSRSTEKTGPPILGSRYLGTILPDTDAVHNIVGVTLLEERRFEDAAAEFREALRRRPDSPDANRNLGTALAASGHLQEAIEYLEKAVTLAPDNDFARRELDAARRRR